MTSFNFSESFKLLKETASDCVSTASDVISIPPQQTKTMPLSDNDEIDYTALTAEAEARYLELSKTVSKFRSNVKLEQEEEEWCRHAAQRSGSELDELRETARNMEEELATLQEEADAL